MSPVALHVRAAAELHAEAGNRHDADPVAVLLAEERHRAAAIASSVDLTSRVDRRVAKDLLVDDALDVATLVVGVSACDVHEVEAQAVGRDERARLLTCVPSTWRSAAWSRCVAVWLRRVASRAPRRRRAVTSSPRVERADVDA